MLLIILKLKKKCKYAVKKLPYIYVPDQYKTQQMCGKAILENGGILESVSDCYKNQEMCNRAVHYYHHALQCVLGCFMTQEICDKIVNTHSSTI